MSPGITVRDDSAHGLAAASQALKKQAHTNGVSNGLTNGHAATGETESRPSPVEQPVQLSPKELYKLHEPVTEVDSRDASTPDNWVPRHKQLIRLTGRHPFNSEPPLPVVMNRGFITPTSLHYVRNHGAVPKLSWDTHTLRVTGMVRKAMTFSMDDLLRKFESHTVTCTLVCAGNRRKEQNMVRKTKGFNWGPSATSTGAWTGVRLVDLLRYCGVYSWHQGARHVHMVGVEGELPQGDTTYGTSLHYGTAMNIANDILVAYMYNGKLLEPDHGFPVRMIIPGGIGGRMVKWLAEISVGDAESDNFYHHHDNKVLPAGVDQERANEEGWWTKSDFVINELNINSIISSPAHDEVIPLSTGTYTVRGYAYTGGGRKVTRIEVSVDDGETWHISNITRHEQPTEYNRWWCWVFFDVDLPVIDLLRAKEIRCRAVDTSNNLQPESLTWNVMGMMNNPHYRIKLSAQMTTNGSLGIHCEHPIKSGGEQGGWMEREAMATSAAAPPPAAAVAVTTATAVVDPSSLKTYTLEEVEQHDSHESCWFVHEGSVYDATKFLKTHPGGAESILLVAGQDGTEDFNAIHSAKARGMLQEYLLGRIADASTPAPQVVAVQQQTVVAAVKEELVALNPKKKIPFKLIEKTALSHNVRRLRFALQSPQHKLGLPVGQHMFFYAKDKGEMVMRAYTPTSSDDELGYFELVVKIYKANEHPKFPLGGRMTQYLDRMAIGDSIDVKGPLGHFQYLGRGRYKHSGHEGHATRLSMIAGGTGITPMWQVVQAILKDPEDRTEMKLIFGNQTQDDILLREDLDMLAKDDRFSVHHVLSRHPEPTWTGGSCGMVCRELVEKHLFPASESTLALLCGPPPMLEYACLPNLTALGYSQDHIITF
jgi:nitrate reductase (NAD(P)H)